MDLFTKRHPVPKKIWNTSTLMPKATPVGIIAKHT